MIYTRKLQETYNEKSYFVIGHLAYNYLSDNFLANLFKEFEIERGYDQNFDYDSSRLLAEFVGWLVTTKDYVLIKERPDPTFTITVR